MALVIVNDTQRAVMEFIATVNRGGHRPTGREVNEWRLRADLRPAQRGKILQEAVPEILERRVRRGQSHRAWAYGAGAVDQYQTLLGSALGQWVSQQSKTTWSSDAILGKGWAEKYLSAVPPIGQSLAAAGSEVIPGRPGRPARYAPDEPAEKFLAHLRRLRWIERDKRRRYTVTQLGHALLRGDSGDNDDKDTAVIVLASEDPLAYGRVLGAVSECGEALIVDPYLDGNELIHILKDSSASRFLVGSKLPPARVTALAVLIRLTEAKDGVTRELRSAKLHDRYVIGEDRVYGLGSSLNGVGRSLTTLIRMPDRAALAIRTEIEDLWENGKVIAHTNEEANG